MAPTRRMLLALAMMVFAATAVSAQGLSWDMTTTQKGEEGGKQTHFLYMPKKYKVVPEGEMASIIRLDQEKIMLVDMKRKRYHEMTFAEMESMVKGMDARMDAMRKQLDALPPEQKKMAEQMMGKMHTKKEKQTIDAEKTGETKTISGFHCTKYNLKRNGEQSAVIWATTDAGVRPETWKTMLKDMEEFGKRMASLMPEGEQNGIEKSLTVIDGFPVQTVMNDGTTMTVTKIEKQSIPASEFDVPAGFTKENKPSMGEQEQD